MKPHNWIPEEPNFRLLNGKPQKGTWHECSGCKHRMFVPNGFSAFQRKLFETMTFIDEVSEKRLHLEDNIVEYEQLCKLFGATKEFDIHAVLAKDCDSAVAWEHAVSMVFVMNS